MTLYGDVVSIAATSAGVAGTITVTKGARLVGLNLAATTTTASTLISKISVKWAGQAEVSYVPNVIQVTSTNGPGFGTCKTPLIDLHKLPAVGNNTVTITVTSLQNVTVEVGLIWIA